MYPPIYLPFFKNFKDLWDHALGRPPLNSSNLSLCPFIRNSHFILFAKCSTMFDRNTWSKIISKNTKLFTSFEKHEQQTHSFWTRKHTKRTSTSASSTVTFRKRNVAKHYGEDLRFKARCSHNTKTRRKKKQKARYVKSWKGDLGNRERPGGLKTRKGGPGKN